MRFQFGKHKGKTFKRILKEEGSYFVWIIEDIAVHEWVKRKYPDLAQFISKKMETILEIQEEVIKEREERLDYLRDNIDCLY